jgi:hypothetical protein
MAPTQQQHYLDVLGVKPGATLDEIHTAYYLHVERFQDNPTEEDLEHQRKVQHAYAVLRRAYDPSVGPPPAVSAGAGRGARKWLAVGAVLAVVGAGVLLVLNYSTIRVHMTDVEPGTVLRVKDQAVPYGTVVGFDPAHRFHTGQPAPAYEIRRSDSGETVWLSKRVVVKGMIAVSGPGPGR